LRENHAVFLGKKYRFPRGGGINIRFRPKYRPLGMLENIPPSVRERLARLSRENKQLKAKVSNKIRGRLGREAPSIAESWVRSRTAVCWRIFHPL
jgi:hypothetical protein